MSDDWDVIIAGAGFAGLSAAEICARKGINCIVLEKNSEIGSPIRTSGGSWIEDLKKLGIPSHLYNPIRTCRFVSPNNEAKIEFKKPYACVLDVRGLRQYLSKRALDAGASIKVKYKVSDVIIKENFVRGVISKVSGNWKKITSKVTIDATGYTSVIARKSGLNPGFRRFGVGSEYEIIAPDYPADEVIFIVGSTFAPSGYGWIFPCKKDNRIRIGVGTIRPCTSVNPKQYLDKLAKFINKKYKYNIDLNKQIEYHSGLIPCQGPLEKTVKNGLIVVGDAAGQPLHHVGEGIRLAMYIGKIAGEIAALAIENENYSEKFLTKYEKLWRKKYEKIIKLSYHINLKISNYDDKKWDNSVELLKKISPEQFYKLLKLEFSKSILIDTLLRKPSLLKAILLNTLR